MRATSRRNSSGSSTPRSRAAATFVGYQPHGTLGRQILDGADEVRIHGKYRAVHAAIDRINGMSAHADQDDLLRWIGSFNGSPRGVFLNHGEGSVSDTLAEAVFERCNVPVTVPEFGEIVQLA